MIPCHSHYPKAGGYIPTCLCDHPEEDRPVYDDHTVFGFLFWLCFALGLHLLAMGLAAAE